MLVYRSTWLIKHGKLKEAVELVKAESNRAGKPNIPARIYSSNISPSSTLVFEQEFETSAQNDKYWEDYWAEDSQEAKAFWNKWPELVERQISIEVWNLTK